MSLSAMKEKSKKLGYNTIVIPNKRSAKISAGAIKASAGAIFGINIYEVSNLSNTIEELKRNNYWILGADINGEDVNNQTFDKFVGEKLQIFAKGFA